MIDAAGVIANFQRMMRIADSPGIPLDARMDALTADLRSELGINRFIRRGKFGAAIIVRCLRPGSISGWFPHWRSA